MCEGCRRRFAQDTLVRFTVHDANGERLIVIDPSGRRKGRGAYTCRSHECFNRAAGRKSKALVRRLGATGVHPDLESEFARLFESRG
ncbi:MAG: YlxR family protein [Thermoleophilia bacterium]